MNITGIRNETNAVLRVVTAAEGEDILEGNMVNVDPGVTSPIGNHAQARVASGPLANMVEIVDLNIHHNEGAACTLVIRRNDLNPAGPGGNCG